MRVDWRAAPQFGHAEVLAAIALASWPLAWWIGVRNFQETGFGIGFVCPFRFWTGFPCPSCGMTHAFVGAARGAWKAAFAASPLGTIAALVLWTFGATLLLCALICFVFGLRRPSLQFSLKEVRGTAVAAALLVLANWIYLLHTKMT